MENEINNEGPLKGIDPNDIQEISNIADDVKAGDDALNKLKVQNLDLFWIFLLK